MTTKFIAQERKIQDSDDTSKDNLNKGFGLFGILLHFKRYL